MKKNLKGCIELFEADEAQILLDMNQYDMIERAGMTPDLRHKKSAHMTAAWHFANLSRTSVHLSDGDLTPYRYLTFSVFSVGGAGGSFSLMFDTDADGAGKNGYEITLPLTRDGWNDYRIELPFLRAIGAPTGWSAIRCICFDCVAGGQANSPDTVLYIDNLFVWETFAPPLYASMPELKGAAVFAKSGNFSIVDRKKISNTPDGKAAKPFEKDGVLWLPMAPVAAGIAHSAVVDNLAETLSFTYRRKKYFFASSSNCMKVGEERLPLGFYPTVVEGMLFFPSEFVRTFFHWRQCFVDPMGLVVLSNRKNVFDSARDAETVRTLVADCTYLRPTADRVLNDLHRNFPNPARGRLLASFDALMQLRRDAKSDEQLGGYVAALKSKYGTKTEAFESIPLSGEINEETLNEAAENAIAFAMLYRVSGDKAYAERVALECEALAALADWRAEASMPTAANVALGVSIGYDWCRHIWSEGRKALIERALLRNALRPALDSYDGKRKMWRMGGVGGATVNAGMIASAVALADVYPRTSYQLLDRALRNVEANFSAYAPDGGFCEGVRAWEKSTRSLSLIVAILRNACGSDYGFASFPGFSATAYFPIHAEGTGGAWNYHNATAAAIDTSMSFFFSKLTGDPIPAWMRRQALLAGKKELHPFDILFYAPVDDGMTPHLPLDAVYRRAGLAMMRSGWDAEANFIGLHGGRNHEPNGDLDAGSFILEMGGERFFSETGGEESLPLLLRRRAAGQNTLTVDPAAEPAPDQNPDAVAPLTEMRSSADRAYAVVDMSTIGDAVLRAKRGAMLTEGREVAVIQDEMTLAHPAEVVWTAWTRAEVKLTPSGRMAKLTQNGKTLVCRLSGVGAPARFAVKEMPESDMKALIVSVTGKEKLRMAVVCRILPEGAKPSDKVYDVKPISRWNEI